ncbi:ABC transporter permease [Propionispora vibrioides]|uniref:Taurine transport system permease protein n=1 Tax=Propionispora vibrioides TaxID=112903 RepID=A0A1H8VZH3_9FIRM|nr:ABC transporter permease subunit [Propionispora vibrioides]SEP20799.1 taurine transport system permease protein [Propionispora vibrioides]
MTRSNAVAGRFWRGDALYKTVSMLAVLIVLTGWEVGSRLHMFNQVFVPSPEMVWRAFQDILAEGYKGQSLGYHIFSSMRRLFLALAMALVTAIPLGLVCGRSRLILAVFDPFIEFYRPLPPLAYYTLLVLWFGITDVSKVALLALSAFPPLFIAAVYSVQRIPVDRINGVKSLGAAGWRLFVYVILPSCLPDLLTGLRTAVGVTYATLVAAEMVAAVSGIGWMVLDASKFLRNDIIYVGIIIMGAIAILLDAGIRLALRRTSPWIGKD